MEQKTGIRERWGFFFQNTAGVEVFLWLILGMVMVLPYTFYKLDYEWITILRYLAIFIVIGTGITTPLRFMEIRKIPMFLALIGLTSCVFFHDVTWKQGVCEMLYPCMLFLFSELNNHANIEMVKLKSMAIGIGSCILFVIFMSRDFHFSDPLTGNANGRFWGGFLHPNFLAASLFVLVEMTLFLYMTEQGKNIYHLILILLLMVPAIYVIFLTCSKHIVIMLLAAGAIFAIDSIEDMRIRIVLYIFLGVIGAIVFMFWGLHTKSFEGRWKSLGLIEFDVRSFLFGNGMFDQEIKAHGAFLTIGWVSLLYRWGIVGIASVLTVGLMIGKKHFSHKTKASSRWAKAILCATFLSSISESYIVNVFNPLIVVTIMLCGLVNCKGNMY